MIRGLPYWLAIPIMFFGVIAGRTFILWLLCQLGVLHDHDRD
jgi:hypothetical protein